MHRRSAYRILVGKPDGMSPHGKFSLVAPLSLNALNVLQLTH